MARRLYWIHPALSPMESHAFRNTASSFGFTDLGNVEKAKVGGSDLWFFSDRWGRGLDEFVRTLRGRRIYISLSGFPTERGLLPTQRLGEFPTRVLCATDLAERFFRELGGLKTAFLPLYPDRSRAPLQDAGSVDGTLIVGVLGRFETALNVHSVLTLAHACERRFSGKVRFVLIGQGALEAHYHQSIETLHLSRCVQVHAGIEMKMDAVLSLDSPSPHYLGILEGVRGGLPVISAVKMDDRYFPNSRRKSPPIYDLSDLDRIANHLEVLASSAQHRQQCRDQWIEALNPGQWDANLRGFSVLFSDVEESSQLREVSA